MIDNNSDDEIQLSDHTLKALQEFLHEREQATNEKEDRVEEDWQDVLNGKIDVTLLEYDERFASKYGYRFVYYDYNAPLTIPEDLHHSFDLVISDPPFLSEDCLVKVAQTKRLLAKEMDAKLILCTGTIMEELARRLLKMHRCNYEPTHERNLGNDFSCFANFETRLL